MSKAFTREDDDAPEPAPSVRVAVALPPGAKNYVTADGAGRMREELARLLAKAAASSATARRVAELREVLATAGVVPAQAGLAEQVRFGAAVTVRDARGESERYRIVGVDEVDLDRGWVSWVSPLARALMHARVGDRVRLAVPAGERVLEVLRIEDGA
jgi:transcription elongation factor GreB